MVSCGLFISSASLIAKSTGFSLGSSFFFSSKLLTRVVSKAVNTSLLLPPAVCFSIICFSSSSIFRLSSSFSSSSFDLVRSASSSSIFFLRSFMRLLYFEPLPLPLFIIRSAIMGFDPISENNKIRLNVSSSIWFFSFMASKTGRICDMSFLLFSSFPSLKVASSPF
ncbi:hypothetical protein [Los Azufres archaeal virus 1]|nr:hypothetical protein [Los Azufres archaeal virus 1]